MIRAHAVPDDPTVDIVGNLPLLFAPKAAALQLDNGSPGIVDPGDVLRYTITIYNNGAVPATYVELTDNVPADTTYVADSTTLNGEPVGQPDGGSLPAGGRLTGEFDGSDAAATWHERGHPESGRVRGCAIRSDGRCRDAGQAR